MPRKEGAKSTRTTYPVEGLHVSSFIMQHETWYWRRPCVITGCDHRMGPDTTKVGWATDWKSCDDQQIPAWAAKPVGGDWIDVGIVCPCHVAEILNQQSHI